VDGELIYPTKLAVLIELGKQTSRVLLYRVFISLITIAYPLDLVAVPFAPHNKYFIGVIF
jgi:hypothetical protein